MDIFFTVDDKFKQYLYVTLYSILSNAKTDDKFQFHILDAGLSDKTKCEIEKFKQIKSFTIDYTPMSDEEFADYPINPTLKSKVYYYRLKIPEKFPNINRALFLDTDIIVQASLSDLFNTNMENKPVACVANGNLEDELQNDRLGLSPEHIYFNAGILLIDCEKWRKENILNKAKQIAATKYNILKWADQDILNIIFENNYQILPLKYNFWPGMNRKGFESDLKNYKKWYAQTNYTEKDLKDAMGSPVIIHYAGGAKPTVLGANRTIKIYNKIQKALKKLSINLNSQQKELYGEHFYKEQASMSYESACLFMPHVMKYCNNPKSVIDLGCGVGTWLKAFKEFGVNNIKGIDGNTIDEKFLYVDRKFISIENLEKLNLNTGKKYDLATSLEVAEHLSEVCSENFLDVLCSYSDNILFSAALPYQGGINHINEQPPEYWYNKFIKRGYYCFDILRKEFLNNTNLPYGCYAQNAFIYTKNPEYLKSLGFEPETKAPMYFYHPWYVETYYKLMEKYKQENQEIKQQLALKKKLFYTTKIGNRRIISFAGIKVSYKRKEGSYV